MAFQYWRNRGRTRSRVACFAHGYHGDTFGAMSLGHSSDFFTPFKPWLFQVDALPAPATWHGDDPHARERAALTEIEAYLAAHGTECAALVIEPLLQGAGGMRIIRSSFVKAVAERARAHGILLIFDEILTGFGRTGTLFAHEHVGIVPDVLCLSKGLTGGALPLGATVASEALYEAFLGPNVDSALLHGHSFTANPLGCAAALASLQLFETERSLERVALIAAAHEQGLARLTTLGCVTKQRGIGVLAAFTIAGVEHGYGAGIGDRVTLAMRERGFLLRALGDVIYMLPPYCTTIHEIASVYDALYDVLRDCV